MNSRGILYLCQSIRTQLLSIPPNVMTSTSIFHGAIAITLSESFSHSMLFQLEIKIPFCSTQTVRSAIISINKSRTCFEILLMPPVTCFVLLTFLIHISATLTTALFVLLAAIYIVMTTYKAISVSQTLHTLALAVHKHLTHCRCVQFLEFIAACWCASKIFVDEQVLTLLVDTEHDQGAHVYLFGTVLLDQLFACRWCCCGSYT